MQLLYVTYIVSFHYFVTIVDKFPTWLQIFDWPQNIFLKGFFHMGYTSDMLLRYFISGRRLIIAKEHILKSIFFKLRVCRYIEQDIRYLGINV